MKQGEGLAFVWVCLYVGGGGRTRASCLVVVNLPECILLPFMYVFFEVQVFNLSRRDRLDFYNVGI